MSAKPPVYVIDDDPEVCRALSLVLTMENFDTRTFDDPRPFLADLDSLPPGVIISDVCMPDADGFDLLQAVKRRQRTDPIILITAHGDVPLAVRAIKLGARDFLEKPFDAAALLRTVSAACDPDTDRVDGEQDRLHGLSRRERQVFQELVRGATNKDIGIRLGISPRTVEVYRAKLMTKMEASTLSRLVRLGIEAGLS